MAKGDRRENGEWMKITIVHVPYGFAGGEDAHVARLPALYQKLGWEASLYSPPDVKPGHPSLSQTVSSLLPMHGPWEGAALSARHADLLHLHNIHPVLGYQFLEWCVNSKKKIWWTMHNHRFFCSNGLALRNSQVCFDCFDKSVKWPALAHNCNGDWKKSVYYSAALTRITQNQIWQRLDATYLAPSPYIQQKLLDFGIAAQRVQLVPNPISFPANSSSGANMPASDILYCGRLSSEKGIRLLLEAASKMPERSFVVAGDGPLRGEVELAASKHGNLKYLGQVQNSQVRDLLLKSELAALPSLCNEILPTFAIEALTLGRRCLVAGMESLQWFARAPFRAALFSPGEVGDFIQRAEALLEKPSPNQNDAAAAEAFFSESAFLEKISLLKQKALS